MLALRFAHIREGRRKMIERPLVPFEPGRDHPPEPTGDMGRRFQRQSGDQPGDRPDDAIFQAVFQIDQVHPRVRARLSPQTLLAISLCGWVKPVRPCVYRVRASDPEGAREARRPRA